MINSIRDMTWTFPILKYCYCVTGVVFLGFPDFFREFYTYVGQIDRSKKKEIHFDINEIFSYL